MARTEASGGRAARRCAMLLVLAAAGLRAPGVAPAEAVYSLDDLLKASVTGNPDIDELLSGVAADRAALDGAQADRLPSLKLADYGTYVANPQAPISISKGSVGTLPLGGGVVIPLPEADTVVVPGAEHWEFDVELQVTQPLFTWGKIAGNVALHQGMLSADGLKVKKKQEEVQTMVRVDYYSLYYLDRLVDLLTEQGAVADQMLQVAQDSYAAGQITEADLAEKRMKIREIGHATRTVEEQRESVLRDLRQATGRPDVRAENVQFSAVDSGLMQRELPEEAALLALALGRNADIRLSRAAEQIYRSKVDITQSDELFKPSLALSVRLGYLGPVLTNWSFRDDWIGDVTLAVSAPLFDGGKSDAAVAEARSQLQQALQQTQGATRSVTKFVSETCYQMSVARDSLAYYAQRVSDAQEIEAYQKQILDAGAGSRVDYYQKRLDVFTEQAHVIEQQLAWAARYFALQNATGGF